MAKKTANHNTLYYPEGGIASSERPTVCIIVNRDEPLARPRWRPILLRLKRNRRKGP